MDSNSPFKSWSVLSGKPIVVRLTQYDEYVVFINGVVMTHAHALQLMMEPFGVYATPEIKRQIKNKFSKMYAAGAFGEEDWNDIVYSENYFQYVKSLVRNNIADMAKDKDINTVLKLLDVKNAKEMVDLA